MDYKLTISLKETHSENEGKGSAVGCIRQWRKLTGMNLRNSKKFTDQLVKEGLKPQIVITDAQFGRYCAATIADPMAFIHLSILDIEPLKEPDYIDCRGDHEYV